MTQGSFIGGWSPKSSNTGEWIQFDLAENTKVTGVATQGRDNADWWTTSYSLSSKVEGGSYESYNNGYVSTISIERFSFECRKTKTKVITLANHKEHRQYSEPIKIRSNYM